MEKSFFQAQKLIAISRSSKQVKSKFFKIKNFILGKKKCKMKSTILKHFKNEKSKLKGI